MDYRSLETLRSGAYAYGNAWRATGRLKQYANGINLEVIKEKPPFVYEGKCYAQLLKEFPDDFVVGSHLTDFLFNTSPPWPGFVRPDAMIFHMNGSMRLTGFAEFRSGALLAEKKLFGFARLLEELRKDPRQLSATLSELGGADMKLPDEWEIPSANEEIEIHFVTPYRDTPGLLYSVHTPFPVSHRLVQAS